MYYFYINPLTGLKLGIKNVIDDSTRVLIKTPKVTEISKKHFNCDSVNGFSIEDNGG